MRKTMITAHVLEMLLVNWGIFVSTGSWGPRPQKQCGSAERAWNSDLSRYVWEGKSKLVKDNQCDEELGLKLEEIIRALPISYVNILLKEYAYKQHIETAYNKAILLSARLEVLAQLETISYA